MFSFPGIVRTMKGGNDKMKIKEIESSFEKFLEKRSFWVCISYPFVQMSEGTISTIMNAAGFGTPEQTTLPAEMVTTIEDCGFFESIPLWAVTLIG